MQCELTLFLRGKFMGGTDSSHSGDSFAVGQHLPLRSQSADAERVPAIWGGNGAHLLHPGFKNGIAAISGHTANPFGVEVMPCM